MRKAGRQLSASPVLIGAVTVLVAIVAVFISYNANQGLPFVPAYNLNAELPSAANLVRGNDVRIGGTRVGSIDRIGVERREDGQNIALLSLKLERSVDPLPVDSTLIVRPRGCRRRTCSRTRRTRPVPEWRCGAGSWRRPRSPRPTSRARSAGT